MFELEKEQQKQGFYAISPAFLGEKEFLKCGNFNNNSIYFFEIVDGKTEQVLDTNILEKLEEIFCYKSDDKIY